MWRMQDMAEGFFLRLRLHLWAQAEQNVFFTSCEFKAFRLIHKVSVPKSAQPSLYIGSPMHPHARKHRRAPPLRPSSGHFSPRRAQGASPSARGREKSGGLWPKSPPFSAENSPLFPQRPRLLHRPHRVWPRKSTQRSKKSDIAPSPLPKIGESCTRRKAKLKRKLRQAFEFLFLSRKRLFVFTASNRNKRRKMGARPKVCVPLE